MYANQFDLIQEFRKTLAKSTGDLCGDFDALDAASHHVLITGRYILGVIMKQFNSNPNPN